MNKPVYQFLVSLGFFIALWYLLSMVDYLGIYRKSGVGRETEKILEKIVLSTFRKNATEITNPDVLVPVHTITNRICFGNGIDASDVQIWIFKNDEINAFAIPGKSLIIYSGLIGYCRSPEELAGVIAHEIAHMEQGHVMKKLTREIGMAVLLTLANGRSGGDVAGEIIRLLSSTAFDREMERIADRIAVGLLENAGIDPEGFASFLERIGEEKEHLPAGLQWISTHPDSRERADFIRDYSNKSKEYAPLMDSIAWNGLLSEY